MQAVTLHNICGRSMTLPLATWAEALSLAETHGWVAAGAHSTLKWDLGPSRSIPAGGWSKEYINPRGQIVTHNDARRISSALFKSFECLESDAIAAVARFCDLGSFLISEVDPDAASGSRISPAFHADALLERNVHSIRSNAIRTKQDIDLASTQK
jgi:hypothetical protein